MIEINGQKYPGAEITDLKRGERRDYKYDLTAESGRKRSELRARYRTYTVTLGSLDQAAYDSLRGHWLHRTSMCPLLCQTVKMMLRWTPGLRSVMTLWRFWNQMAHGAGMALRSISQD